MKLILASGNKHKAQEFSELFDKDLLEVSSSPESIDVVEDGSTYEENAFKKAKAYYEKFKQPVMSDDSGLNVESLPDDLGIYSARFGGPGLSDNERCYKLLEKLSDQPEKAARRAFFTCVLCFYLSHDEVFFFEGRMPGHISRDLKGEKGFGYDSVFVPEAYGDDETTVSMIPEWKSQNSHRSKACDMASKFFKERVGQI